MPRPRRACRASRGSRDIFVGAGAALSPVRSDRLSMPIFLGIGVRRELWRDTLTVDGIARSPTGWEAFAWLEVALAVERVQ